MEIIRNEECCSVDELEVGVELSCNEVDRWRLGRWLINLGSWGGTGSISALRGLTVSELYVFDEE